MQKLWGLGMMAFISVGLFLAIFLPSRYVLYPQRFSPYIETVCNITLENTVVFYECFGSCSVCEPCHASDLTCLENVTGPCCETQSACCLATEVVCQNINRREVCRERCANYSFPHRCVNSCGNSTISIYNVSNPLVSDTYSVYCRFGQVCTIFNQTESKCWQLGRNLYFNTPNESKIYFTGYFVSFAILIFFFIYVIWNLFPLSSPSSTSFFTTLLSDPVSDPVNRRDRPRHYRHHRQMSRGQHLEEDQKSDGEAPRMDSSGNEW